MVDLITEELKKIRTDDVTLLLPTEQINTFKCDVLSI